MGCVSLRGHGPISDEAFEYMHLACELSGTASSLESAWDASWFMIAAGLAPFLVALARGKAGYPTLVLMAAMAVFSSFSIIQAVTNMNGAIERIERQKATWDGVRPLDAPALAESSGLTGVMHAFIENNTKISNMERDIFFLQYISGCLVVIAGWSSTTVMSRRIKRVSKT